LVDPKNPLTARVTVNRQWAAFFGRGIVRTLEDFGTQGDPPTHPELLDWLAAYFVGSDGAMERWSDGAIRTESPDRPIARSPDRGGRPAPPPPHRSTAKPWSLKALHRLIVTSATYQQSSRATAEQLAKDSENRFLSRGPRVRLEAELVRDAALKASGLLSA